MGWAPGMDCVLFVSLIIFVYVNSGVIVGEYILVGIFFLGHHGGSYLAQAHAVSPSGTSERELLRMPSSSPAVSTTKAEL